MHHGPVLNLYDYCRIVLEYLYHKKLHINTFRTSDLILREHFENNIQVVMLSSTVHQLVHSKKVFIHPNQSWGNLERFLEKYKEGVVKDIQDKINDYYDLCGKYNETFDRGFLNLNKRI